MYDAEGQLVYVGTTGSLLRRFREHKYHQDWWTEVASVTLEHFESREECMAAELRIIEEERPRGISFHPGVWLHAKA